MPMVAAGGGVLGSHCRTLCLQADQEKPWWTGDPSCPPGLLPLFSRSHSWDLRCLHVSCPLRAALPTPCCPPSVWPELAGPGSCRDTPAGHRSHVWTAPPPRLPEQAACVRGGEGLGEAVMPASVDGRRRATAGRSREVGSVGGEERVGVHRPPPGLEDRPELAWSAE